MLLFILCLPWIVTGLYVAFAVRVPPALPSADPGSADDEPLVSIIIPARNEEKNIGVCVGSLARSTYPAFEIIVVDDQSQDRTADVVRSLPVAHASAIRVLSGEPLPEGWFGKPWACWQGAQAAEGELLLFTDADTVHGPGLLARAVRGMRESRADVLTIIGRQIMGTFWERLAQPQFFMLLALRYPRTGATKQPRRWRDAIANGQYLLFREAVYREEGGHGAVRGEVVEDLRLAQILVRAGRRLTVRGDNGLETRMYTSRAALIEGWSKNVATAALQATPRWIQPWILPLSLLVGFGVWLLPPIVLAWALVTGVGGLPLTWAVLTTAFNVLVWGGANVVMRGNPLLGLLYPLGVGMAGYIMGKSWLRGSDIQWKGRSYRMSREARLGKEADV